MANTITTRRHKNEFSGFFYYVILVDGVSLEDYVLKTKHAEIKAGLVPTLLNWLDDPGEREEVWKRVLSEDQEAARLPILMCSEDIDFGCTLIMTEVRSDSQHVYWERFGLEESDSTVPTEVGTKVLWFDDILPLKFARAQYEEVLTRFRQHLDESTARQYQ